MVSLSYSLFCRKNEWHRLFAEAILPFVTNKPFLYDYTIEFNYVSGENIRMILLVDDIMAADFAKIADSHFKDFFSTLDSPTTQESESVNGIFMPFPENTIQYGLYPLQTLTHEENPNKKFANKLSPIILLGLKDDIIDKESILTFAFYLQISLIKAIKSYIDDIDALFSIIVGEKRQQDLHITESVLTANEDLMQQITDDIMEADFFDDELNWLNEWLTVCKESLEQNLTMEDKKNSIKGTYDLWIIYIDRHLNIDNDRDLLYHLTIRSCWRYFLHVKN